MPENGNSAGWLASLPNDSVAKTLIMAVGICLICSVAVSVTAAKMGLSSVKIRSTSAIGFPLAS